MGSETLITRGAGIGEQATDSDIPAESIAASIRHHWSHPDAPNLSRQKVDELVKIGRDLTLKAEHVPFGSLASAIGRTYDVPITLWSFDEMDKSGSGGRAIRYHRNPPDGAEEIILFAPSTEVPGSLDFETRYAVAHELAHIALGHPPRLDGPSPPSEEAEAHYLATIFLRLHGAPTGRTFPDREGVASILRKTDLPLADQMHLLDRLDRLDNHGGDALKPSEPDTDDVGAVDFEKAADETLLRYATDAGLREQVASQLSSQVFGQ